MSAVKIITRETIKPSSPTPDHLRNYNLCLLDQLCPSMYSPIVLFYSAINPNKKISNEKSHLDLLKKSLSETLTHFYPFAGRFKDSFTIDCNDDGAVFVEAHVHGDMSAILKKPEIDQLEQLLPFNTLQKTDKLNELVILGVQVNHFECGGVAIGVSIWHSIADAATLASFVKIWSTFARGGGAAEKIDVSGVVFDCTSLFPPQDLSGFSTGEYIKKDLLPKIVTKKFFFDGSKIAAIREKISDGPCLDQPTRVEAVSALIWGAVIASISAHQEDDQNPPPLHVAVNLVNLRKRMNPPLPEHCLGNIIQMTIAAWPGEMPVDYNGLAGRLRESIQMMKGDYLRKLHENGGYLNFIKQAGEMHGNGSSMKGVFSFSSWCRFPFYETDFGWGLNKPIWVASAMRLDKLAILVDASDGHGIEAWVGMTKDEMLKFEQDPGILAFASSNPTISA
ncbi:hypothetical protein Q3G72_024546 [Acer saccharum]|nr:hypothetical protein Q3G72_024546 [Acer saccharum]